MSNTPSPINTRLGRGYERVADPENHPWLEEGRAEFNAGRHWHAHEAWEHLWLRLEGDDKVFVQGLIMAAAMLVQYDKNIARGVANHWANVQRRLPQNAPEKWGIDVAQLLGELEPFANDAVQGTFTRPLTINIRRAKYDS